MKRYGYLFASITSFANLYQAAKKARRGKQHRLSVANFWFHLEPELLRLQDELQSGTYRMRPYHTFTIYEPKQRQICAADFRDRVVHHAICAVLDPIFDACLIHDTYACRRGKGTWAAIQRAQQLARRLPYVLTCDVRKYFESVDHAVLKTLLRRKIKDRKLLPVLDQIIDHPIPGGLTGKGLPIGNLTSQYFANLYLSQLDHFVKERLRLPGYVRYMDDFLVLADNKPLLHETLSTIRIFLQEHLQLALKDQAIQIMPVTQGIPFLGMRIFPQLIKLQRTKWVRFTRTIRQLENQYRCGMITEAALARSVASMIGHTLHANALAARKQLFARSLPFG